MLGNVQMIASVPASDLDRARNFYEQRLGLEVVEVAPDKSAVFYDVGGSPLMVFASENAGTNKATAASIVTDDFEGTLAYLREHDVPLDEVSFGEFATVDGVITMPDGSRCRPR